MAINAKKIKERSRTLTTCNRSSAKIIKRVHKLFYTQFGVVTLPYDIIANVAVTVSYFLMFSFVLIVYVSVNSYSQLNFNRQKMKFVFLL